MMNKIKHWLKDFPSTNARIATSLVLAIIYVLMAMIFDAANHPISEHTLSGIGLFILAVMGIDVTQFIGKRFSDVTYAQAKFSQPSAPPPSTTTQAAVVVQQQPAAPPPPPTPPANPDV